MEQQEHFGEYLKAQREKKGIRLEEIASITKIHLRSLELLEAAHWKELPPEPFIRGFIIAYAKYVGLEPKEVLNRYYQEMGKQPVAAPPAAPVAPVAERTVKDAGNADKLIESAKPVGGGKLVATAGFAAVLVVAAAVIYIGKRTTPTPSGVVERAERVETSAASDLPPAEALAKIADSTTIKAKGPETTTAKANAGEPRAVAAEAAKPENPAPKVEPAKAETKPEPAKVAETAPASQPEASTSPKSEPAKEQAANAAPEAPAGKPEASRLPTPTHTVEIESKVRSWIKVVIDDKPPVQSFLAEGEKATYTAQDKIKVVMGNSAGAKVYHNGELDNGTKFDGTIRYYRWPAHAKFPQDKGTKRHIAAKAESKEKTNQSPTESAANTPDAAAASAAEAKPTEGWIPTDTAPLKQ